MAARHGTRTKYNEGCRCEKCKLAEATYRKTKRHNITPLHAADAPPEREPGPVEAAIIAEFAGTSVPEAKATLYQTALVLAQGLDNPVNVARHSSSAKTLSEIHAQLRKGTEKKGKLSNVRQMSRPQTSAG